jgi:hypothetical protein
LRTDGQRRFIQQIIFPIRTAKGFRVGSISRDMTEQKQANEKLQRAYKEIDEVKKKLNTSV